MGRAQRRPWRGSLLALSAAFVLLASCNTIAAFEQLPEDWWVGLESVFVGLWEDLMSVVELVM